MTQHASTYVEVTVLNLRLSCFYLFALQFDQSIADLSAELMRDHHDRFRILHEERHQPDGQQFVVVGFVSRANYAPVEGVDHLSEFCIVIKDSLWMPMNGLPRS